MIVVSDTTPLNYLILIGEENPLEKLFENVVIPQAVFDELQAEGASETVRNWVNNPPLWIEVKQSALTADASLDALHDGEREAILLAQELTADLLLVDDKQARLAAVSLSIAITGTLGVLDRAAKANLIDLKTTLDALQKTSFHIADDLVQKLLDDDAARKPRK